jgi:hypothetical protein
MQAWYPARFEREMGCTEAELLGWFPGAARECEVAIAPGSAQVSIGEGVLRLHWRTLPPRRIALLQMPRLALEFVFDGVADDVRQQFMRYFDLYTQRGGG